MENERPDSKVTRPIEGLLGVAALVLLLVGCFLVLRPFLSALMWAVVLAFALWPLQLRFTKWFGGFRTLAALVVTLLLALVLVGPFLLIGISVADDARELGLATKRWIEESVPDDPPPWLAQAPIVGDEAAAYWKEFADDRRRWMEQLNKAAEEAAPRPTKILVEDGDKYVVTDAPPAPAPPDEPKPDVVPVNPADEEQAAKEAEAETPSRLVELLGRSIAALRKSLIAGGIAIGQGVVQVVLSVFLMFFLLRHGAALAKCLRQGIDRIAGTRGAQLVDAAGDTVRGVVYGILGTAFVQAVVAGLGFWLAGVPGAVLLASLTFFFSPVPVGPPLIWIPATVWLFSQGAHGWGIFMGLWGTFVISGVDNIVKPYLISQGSKMPFVLIFCGVIGGALAFGVVGVFLGPTLLAVVFRLVEQWLEGDRAADPEPASPEVPATG
jgi:predicted PurR-regulated permease PerM